MLFNSAEYAVFLAVVFVVFWALARLQLARTLFLFAASYFFYAYWNPKYLLLIWATCTLDFLIARRLATEPTAGRRKALLVTSVVVNLSVLGMFKYFNFFADSAAAAFNLFGVQADHVHLDVVLPVGISFYTFQAMAYVIDVYRGNLKPARSYLRYLLFVAFFPHLVAGPIMRASLLLPQFDKAPVLRAGDGADGLFRIMVGLFKKVLIADFLAANLVDRVFDYPDHFSSLEVLVGVYAYALQIYCDFSGYSDIAIGSAKLLGFKLMKNFDAPYKAHSLQDFWHRWHISLSTWLRDYLYVPLGGSRGSAAKTYRNLLVTMLLGGLWHGASWTFVIWGAMHGGALAATRAWQRWRDARWPEWRPSQIGRAVAVVLTFHFVCLAWVFFRAEDLPGAWAVLAQIGEGSTWVANLPAWVLAALGAGFAAHWMPDRWEEFLAAWYRAFPAPAQATVLAGALVWVHHVAQQQTVPFIYFQF